MTVYENHFRSQRPEVRNQRSETSFRGSYRLSVRSSLKLFTARCREEIALRRARRRKCGAGCRAAELWPQQRRAEKARNGAAPFYDAPGKVRRFEIMWIPCLIFDPGKGPIAD